LTIHRAARPLDWIVSALSSSNQCSPLDAAKARVDDSLFRIQAHTADEMDAWHTEPTIDQASSRTRSAAASLEQLPGSEPVAHDDEAVEATLARLDFLYPALATASIKAAVAASEFKRTYDFATPLETRPEHPISPELSDGRDLTRRSGLDSPAVRRGVITHRILQHLDLAAAAEHGVAIEVDRLILDGVIERVEAGSVDVEGLDWFVQTPLGKSIRRAGTECRREFSFISAEPPDYFDPSIEAQAGDAVLVRGIVDLILPTPAGIELVDYKTDAILASNVPGRAEAYRSQMDLYARAMSRLWRKRVVRSWLVFLTPRAFVSWPALDESEGT
jgi:ATP-dependent helicase/nuclease subunit A